MEIVDPSPPLFHSSPTSEHSREFHPSSTSEHSIETFVRSGARAWAGLLEDVDSGMFDRAHTCTVPDRYLWLSYSALYEVYADPVDVSEISADYHWIAMLLTSSSLRPNSKIKPNSPTVVIK